MSRFEESKIIEHDVRIEHMEMGIKALKEEKESPEKMVEIRVVALELTPDQYKIGEARMNSLISKGFILQREFPRDSGIVFVMSRWAKKSKEVSK
mgnify:FL=1